MSSKIHTDCCSNLFAEFHFQDLRTAAPPDQKGVYAIRIKHRGQDTSEVIKGVKQLIDKLNWPTVGGYILDRISRLDRIGECPIIYIGSAGTHEDSKNTLSKRYKEFSGRHTAMYPLWALVYSGWDLEFGWIETKDAGQLERTLKERYQQKHDGKLPAIVQR